MKSFSTSQLLPPQMQILYPDSETDYGLVKSSRGTYFVRYRSIPLTIEILAPGVTSRDDSFLVRIPDTASSKQFGSQNEAGFWASVYIAPKGDAKIPPAFSVSEVYQKFGWGLEPLRFTQLTNEQAKSVQNWLYQQK